MTIEQQIIEACQRMDQLEYQLDCNDQSSNREWDDLSYELQELQEKVQELRRSKN